MPADETASQAKRREDGYVFLAWLVSQAALPSGARLCLCALGSWHGAGDDLTTNTAAELPELQPGPACPAGTRAESRSSGLSPALRAGLGPGLSPGLG